MRAFSISKNLRVLGLGAATISTAVIAACSSGGSSNEGNTTFGPLSDNQSTQLKTQMSAVGQIMALSDDLQSEASNGGTSRKSVLTKFADSSACVKQVLLPQDGVQLRAGDLEVGAFSVDVSGPACPIRFHLGLKGHNTLSGFSAQYQMSYESLDPKSRTAVDIRRFDFAGTFAAEVSANDPTHAFNFSIHIDGNGQSVAVGPFQNHQQTDGQLMVVVNNSKVSFGGQEHEIFEFDDAAFGARLERQATLGAKPTAVNVINNSSATDDDYRAYRDLLDMPGFLGPVADTPEPARSPSVTVSNLLSCSVDVYAAIELSALDAQTLVSHGIEPAIPRLGSSLSCGKSQSTTVALGEQNLRIDLDRTNSAALVSLSICDSVDPRNCSRADRGYAVNASTGYADSLGAFTTVTMCKPVVGCLP